MCQWAESRQKVSKEFWHGTFGGLSGQIPVPGPVVEVSKNGTRQLTATLGGQARSGADVPVRQNRESLSEHSRARAVSSSTIFDYSRKRTMLEPVK